MLAQNRRSVHGLSVRLSVVVLTTATATTAFAQAGRNPNPGVLPPNSTAFGKTYAEWSAEHWKWTYSLPADHHPLTDTADCSTGQSGKVWFLGGTFAPTPLGPGLVVGVAHRNCRIPSGIALFFPILDVEASILEGNGTNEAELRTAAAALQDHAENLECTIDGVPVADLERYRVQSPLFTFGPLPANNLLGAPAGAMSLSVADGVYLLLAPLSAGQHTIHFSGDFRFTVADDGFDFEFILDISYNLTVGAGR
jgi:hypothetical protein